MKLRLSRMAMRRVKASGWRLKDVLSTIDLAYEGRGWACLDYKWYTPGRGKKEQDRIGNLHSLDHAINKLNVCSLHLESTDSIRIDYAAIIEGKRGDVFDLGDVIAHNFEVWSSVRRQIIEYWRG